MKKMSTRLTRFAITTAFVCMLLPAFAEGGGVGGQNLPPPPASAAVSGQSTTVAIPSAVCK